MSDTPSSTAADHAHERFWRSLDGTPGEILWEADTADLDDDVGRFAAAFGQRLPVVDLGCGDGRQTRLMARHFRTVIGLDIAATAIKRANATANPPNVTYRVLDARDPDARMRCTTRSVTPTSTSAASCTPAHLTPDSSSSRQSRGCSATPAPCSSRNCLPKRALTSRQ